MATREKEEQFQIIASQIVKLNDQYIKGTIKHMQFAQQMDSIFESYGWKSSDFYKEANRRLNVQNNKNQEEDKKTKKSSGKPKKIKYSF